MALSPNGQCEVSSFCPGTSGSTENPSPSHRSGHRLHREVVARIIGDPDLCCQLLTKRAADVLRDLGDIFWRYLFEDFEQHFDQHLEATWGEVHRYLFVGRLVGLGGTAGAMSPARVVADAEVSVIGKSVQVMTSNIGMDVKESGDHRRGQGLTGFPDCDVDSASRGVAEGGGQIRDSAIERLDVHDWYRLTKTIVLQGLQ